MIRPSMKRDAFSWDDPCFRPVMAYPGLQATPVMQEKKMSKVQKSRVVHLWRSAASTMRDSPSNCQKVIRWKNPRGTFTQPWTFCCSCPWHFRSNDPKNGTFTAPAFCSFRYPPNCGAEHRQTKKTKHNKATIRKMMKMELICKFWGGITAMLGLKSAQQLCQLSCSQEAPWSLRTSSLARYTLASGLLDGANYHPSSMAGNGKLYCQWVDFPLQSLIPGGHVWKMLKVGHISHDIDCLRSNLCNLCQLLLVEKMLPHVRIQHYWPRRATSSARVRQLITSER